MVSCGAGETRRVVWVRVAGSELVLVRHTLAVGRVARQLPGRELTLGTRTVEQVAFDILVVGGRDGVLGLGRDAVRDHRSVLGAVALDVYAIATRLSKQEDGAEFLPYVETIREMLKQKKGRKTNSSPDSAPLVPSAVSK